MDKTMVDPHELVARGRAYYDKHLRARVEPEHVGKFLALDVESGDYEVDEDELAAIHRAEARHPNSLFYVMRVGFRAAHHIGGGSVLMERTSRL
ncbi:MAG: hypothetical protein FJ290_13400 [Planctomycetes bacterium]|nr:hypothetical protein [Planctomycetota bacterium]